MKRKWIPPLLLVLALLLTACGGENTAAGTAQTEQAGQTEQADQAAPQSEEDSLVLESCPLWKRAGTTPPGTTCCCT